MTRGVLSSATRISRIVNWLDGQRSDRNHTLKLEIEEENGMTVLGTWERGEASEHAELAGEVDRAIQGQADETGVRIEGKVAWYTQEDRPWVSMKLRADPAQGAQLFDGSNKSQAIQAQRYSEATMQLMYKSIDGVVNTQNRTLEAQERMLEQYRDMVTSLETQMRELREENAELRELARMAERSAEETAQVAEDAIGKVEEMRTSANQDNKVVEMLSQALAPRKPKAGNANAAG